jgi:DNA polymerase-3 subunit delta
VAEKSQIPHAFEILEGKGPSSIPAVIGCFGTDDFLRRTCIDHLLGVAQLEEESIRSFDSDEASWRDVHDQLATRSLFDAAGGRVAVVRNADKFLSKYREPIEKWIEGSFEDCTLILDIQTLPANTRIYQLIGKRGLLVKCTPPQKSGWGNPPDDKAMQRWVENWGESKHRVKLTPRQSSILVERIGAVCGLIDSELAKLALFADATGSVSDGRVDELVGGWRTQTAWEVADAIAEGKVAVALEQIEKLVHAGQSALGLAAQLCWSLRRFGVAAQIVEQSESVGQKIPLGVALERAGFNRYDLPKAEGRLRRIGRVRAKRLLNELVELELMLKGSHSNEYRARFALESMILRMA